MRLRNSTKPVQKSGALTRRGFTLMEVLIVVAIIVVLAGVGAFYLLPRLDEAKEQKAQADVKALTEMCNTFKLNNGQYPGSLSDLTTVQPNGGKPLAKRDAIYDPWDQPYQYDPSGSMNDGMEPSIWTVSPDQKKIGNWSKR